MKNKFILGYSIIASIFIVFSVSFFGFNLYREYSFGESRTNTNFIRTVGRIKTTSYQNDLYSDNYTAKLVQAIGNFDDISFIEIKRDGITVLAYPDSARKNEKSNLTMEYSDKALIHDSTLEIDASLYLLRPVSIHYYAKISFLMILIVTIITIILIIYIQMKESGEFQTSNSNEINTDNENDTIDEDDENIAENIEEEPVEEKQTEETKIEEETALNEAAESTESKESAETKDSEPADAIENEKIEEKTERKPEVKPLHEEKAVELPSENEKPVLIETSKEEVGPNGLFSPVTGLGWESYLMTRLENEVNRAVASEMDLSLFVIQIENAKRDSEIVKNTCNYLAIQFQFKDLLFEYKDDCIVAMKINMNLDEALNFADKLHEDISNIIAAEDKKCFIGISTRSIRIVAAERLLTEAEQAMEHAKTDPASPIIAFRADSEKYRQYLEENR